MGDTDKVCTVSNHLSREPGELGDLLGAIESAGYTVEGPKSRDSMGGLIKGSDYNDWYWLVRE